MMVSDRNRDSMFGSFLSGDANPPPTSSMSFSPPLAPIAAVAQPPSISKRTNARLQLAAALIEADNENVVETAQRWHESHQSHSTDGLRPPPPPQPKLASQSAIFAPYRDNAVPKLNYHVRTWSTGGVSRLQGPTVEGKSSVDFLRVALPTEKKSSSRAGSSVAADLEPADSVSQPVQAPSTADTQDALSDWGVDKFLSKEERDRIEQGRKRGNSIAGYPLIPTSSAIAQDDKPSPLTARRSLDLATDNTGAIGIVTGKARSEIIPASNRTSSNAHLDLLARIKLYRERQENLPPSQWGGGPGPTASENEVADHIIATLPPTSQPMSPPAPPPNDAKVQDPLHDQNENDRASVTSGSILNRPRPHSRSASFSSSALPNDTSVVPQGRSLEHKPQVRTASSQRRISTAAITGDSWSDQGHHSDTTGNGDQGKEKPATLSNISSSGDNNPNVEPSNAEQQQQGRPKSELFESFGRSMSPSAFSLAASTQLELAFGNEPSQLADMNKEANPAQQQQQQESEQVTDMAGVGSYLRSQSRRNSFMGAALFNSHNPQTGPSRPNTPGTIMPSELLSAPGTPGTMMPREIPSRPTTPGTIFGITRGIDPSMGLPEDSMADLLLGPSPFSAGLAAASTMGIPASPGPRMVELYPSQNGTDSSASFPSRSTNLTTKQLQEFARTHTFPEHLGINRDLWEEPEDSDLDDDLDYHRIRASIDAASLAENLANTPDLPIQLGRGEPDLSSANWGKPRKSWFRVSRLSMLGPIGDARKDQRAAQAVEKAANNVADGNGQTNNAPPRSRSVDLSESYFAEPAAKMTVQQQVPSQPEEEIEQGEEEEVDDDIDDDYVSPPKKGPLRPLGLVTRLPTTLIMPQPLEGTKLTPRTRLTEAVVNVGGRNRQSGLYVPDGFVLHDGKGLPPTRSLQVASATGPRPLFAASGGDKNLDTFVDDLKAIEVSRTLKVPAAAPKGIGRRAAVPTTVLFRNQLVQHEEEREGWGWEVGTRAENTFRDPNCLSSDDDDKPLAQLKKQGRTSKRAAKKLAKEKRKRKQARRERQAKRERAICEGKSFAEVGVSELSPDEDLDLSSTTSGSETTDGETDSDDWVSEDEKRWLDTKKPAGKLYGKSLLDVADERNLARKTKARFYGEVTNAETGDDVEADSKSKNNLAVEDDATSLTPSAAAKSFHHNPAGYNDTRQRMEAAFGTDVIWQREMAKRLEEEAREAQLQELQRLTEEEFQKAEALRKERKREKRLFRTRKAKKGQTAFPSQDSHQVEDAMTAGQSETAAGADQGIGEVGNADSAFSAVHRTPLTAPVLELNLTLDSEIPGPGKSRRRKRVGEAAAEWFVPSSDEESSEGSSSDDEEERKRQAMRRARQSINSDLKLYAEDGDKGHGNDADDDSSDEDNIPLSQVRKNVVSRHTSMAGNMLLGNSKAHGESSDEELPLAVIRAKRHEALMKLGKLDLDFDGGTDGIARSQSHPAARPRPKSLSNRSSPVSSVGKPEIKGILKPSTLLPEITSTWDQKEETEDDSDEDLPLVVRHPNGEATLAATKAALAALKGSDDEDDKPLGAAHPQAAIIAEQAALIRQLQAENEHAKAASLMTNSWSAMTMPGMMGAPAAASTLGFGAMGGAPPSMMGFGPPVAEFPPPIMSHPVPMFGHANMHHQSMLPMSSPSQMMLDPKTSTIQNWRSQVPLDANPATTKGDGLAIHPSH